MLLYTKIQKFQNSGQFKEDSKAKRKAERDAEWKRVQSRIAYVKALKANAVADNHPMRGSYDDQVDAREAQFEKDAAAIVGVDQADKDAQYKVLVDNWNKEAAKTSKQQGIEEGIFDNMAEVQNHPLWTLPGMISPLAIENVAVNAAFKYLPKTLPYIKRAATTLYKYNPKARTPNPNNYYRMGSGKGSIDDVVTSGRVQAPVVLPKPTVQPPPIKSIPSYAPVKPKTLTLPPRKGYGNTTGDNIINTQANLLRNKGVGPDAFEVSEAVGRYAHTTGIPAEVYRGVKIPLTPEGFANLSNKRIMNYSQAGSKNIMYDNKGFLKMQSYAIDPDLRRFQGIDGTNIGNSNFLHNNVWTSNLQGASEYGRYSAPNNKVQGLLQKFSVDKSKPLFGVESQSIGKLQNLMSKTLKKPINNITLKESESLLRKWGIDFVSGKGFRGVPEYHFLPSKITPTTSKFIYKKGGLLYK